MNIREIEGPYDNQQNINFSQEECEKRLDQLFDEAFNANHPAAFDYASLKIAFKNAKAALEILKNYTGLNSYYERVVKWGLGEARKPEMEIEKD